jgi:membrane fusion protein, multidrug efflux system
MRLLGLTALALSLFTPVVQADDLRLNSTTQKSSSLQARGLVRAVREATLSSEQSARIIHLVVKDGDAFRQGDLLVDFDCERPKAEWKTAEAERMGMAAAYENSRRLAEYRAAGTHDVQMARAALEKSSASVEVIMVRLKQCRIFAPFDGRVAELPVREHEMPQAGQPLMRIVSDAYLEVDMIVPAKWLRWLKPGENFRFSSEDTALQADGEIIRLSGAIDPVSQTIRVVGKLKAQPGAILPGQGGLIIFERPT